MKNFPIFTISLTALAFIFLTENLSAQIREIRDISYLPREKIENDSLQRLNLVLPESHSKPPLLVWIGGGAWSYVDRDIEMNFANKMADNGIAVATIGHRLSSALWRDSLLNMGYQHPDHIEDLAAAFHFLFDHATEYGYDPEKIFVGGYSSGAHLAALLVLSPKYLDQYQLTSDNVKGIIPIAGTYDIPNYHEVLANSARPELAELHVESVFGKSLAQQLDASPTHFLENLKTPILLISERDSYNYTRLFEDKIIEKEFTDISILHIREMGHSALWKDLSFSDKSKYRNLMVDFIKKVG